MGNEQDMLMHLVSELARLRRAWASLAVSGELSAAQFATMMHIAHGERPWLAAAKAHPFNCGVTLSELATMERHSLPAASKRISQLEEAGLVRREVSSQDRRVTRLYLTDEGLAMLQNEQRRIGERTSSAFDCLGRDKAEMLIRLTGEFADALEQINTGLERM